MKAEQKTPPQKHLEVAKILENRILPRVLHIQWVKSNSCPYESSESNEDILRAAIDFLRGENSHLSAFTAVSTMRWQGAQFVIWLKEILERHAADHPPLTGKEALMCMTPFLHALLNHKDLPQEID